MIDQLDATFTGVWKLSTANKPFYGHHADGLAAVMIDQRKPAPIDKLTISAVEYRFDGSSVVTISNDSTDGYVVVDAVRFLSK